MNICCILDKIETEGNIVKMTSLFDLIIGTEIVYAVTELKKLSKKNPSLNLKK